MRVPRNLTESNTFYENLQHISPPPGLYWFIGTLGHWVVGFRWRSTQPTIYLVFWYSCLRPCAVALNLLFIFPVAQLGRSFLAQCWGQPLRILPRISLHLCASSYGITHSVLCFLAPAGRHVYSTCDIPNPQAPAGRHVYHVSSSSPTSKTYFGLYGTLKRFNSSRCPSYECDSLYPHCAPLEHVVWGMSSIYRHIAPLERKQFPTTRRLLCLSV